MENASRHIRQLIRRINQRIFELLSCELSAVGITVPQFLVLRTLKEERKKISEISRQVSLSNSTVSGIVDRLEAEGYVQRVRDAEDRRVVWVYRTEKLERLDDVVPIMGDTYFESFLVGISDEETAGIVKSLELLANQLEKQVHQRKCQD